MNSSIRVLFNTLSLYAKMLITTIVSLYLTRIVLMYLGASDFGIYSLIGGVISLLSFVNSALMVSTQRFLSVALGEKSIDKVKNIFISSLLIHVFLAIILISVFEICSVFLFNGFLNIPIERLEAARQVYQLMIVSTVFTILGVPYNAIINAKEDLWLFSVVETICAILKLGVILMFHYTKNDALVVYSLWILIITIINFIFKYLWCRIKYTECKNVCIRGRKYFSLMKEMLSFSSWNAFGTLAVIGRNQGIAIVLNLFWGTAINAVYGIANQVNSQLIYFSTMMTTSMTPQIMKSFGEGNKSRMLSLAIFTCKLSFFLSAVFAIPLLLELNFVLNLWLKNVPEYTEVFCSLIIVMFLFMQIYPGLNRAIQASGRIKWYQIFTSFVLLIPIPIGLIFGKKIGESYFIIYLMILSQILQMFVAIYMSKRLVGLSIRQFVSFLVKALLSFIIVYFFGYYIKFITSNCCSDFIEFFIVVMSVVLIFSLFYYFFVFDKNDRERVIHVLQILFNRA